MKNYSFRNLGDSRSLSSVRTNLSLSIGLTGYPKTEQFVEEFIDTLYSVNQLVSNLQSNRAVEEWEAASKRHKDKVSCLMTKIIQISKSEQVSNPISSVTRSKIVFYDGTELTEESIQPRSFWKQYRILRYLSYCESADQLNELQRAIVTLFVIHKDLEVTGSLLDTKAMEHVNEIEDTSLVDSTEIRVLPKIHEFLDLMDDAIMNGIKDAERWTPSCDILLASVKKMQKEFERPSLDKDHLPMSTKSTCTVVNGMTVPGILASAYERDFDFNHKEWFDNFTGYIPSEVLSPLSNMKFKVNKATAIPHRSKPDVRLIYTGCNPLQDRMHYFAELDKIYLRNRSSIAIWNQQGAVRRIMIWFDKDAHAIYSLDLHAATDRLSRVEQAEVKRYLLRWFGYEDPDVQKLVEIWLEIMSRPQELVLPHSRKVVKYNMATGQPMGFEDSVFSLNVSHDMWVLALRWIMELEYKSKFIDHKILGDDFTIAIKEDKGFVFPRLYQQLMAELNTECNLSKGYIFNKDYPGYEIPVAEFAKNLICDGINITPYPLGALFKGNTLEERLGFLRWVLDHSESGRKLTLDELLSIIDQKYHELALLSISSGIPNTFSGLIKDGGKKIFPSTCNRAILATELAYAKDLIALKVLANRSNDSDYIPKVTDITSFTNDWKRLARPIISNRDMLTNNKFISLLSILELTAMAEGLVSDEILSGNNILMEEQDQDLADLIPEIRAIFRNNPEDYLKLLDLINLVELGEDDLLNDRTSNAIIDSLQNLFKDDMLDTNRRFGSPTDGRKFIVGLDLDKLSQDVTRFLTKLNVDESEVCLTQRYALEFYGSERTPLWETNMLQEVLEKSENDEDKLSWDDILNLFE